METAVAAKERALASRETELARREASSSASRARRRPPSTSRRSRETRRATPRARGTRGRDRGQRDPDRLAARACRAPRGAARLHARSRSPTGCASWTSARPESRAAGPGSRRTSRCGTYARGPRKQIAELQGRLAKKESDLSQYVGQLQTVDGPARVRMVGEAARQAVPFYRRAGVSSLLRWARRSSGVAPQATTGPPVLLTPSTGPAPSERSFLGQTAHPPKRVRHLEGERSRVRYV